MRIRHVIPTVGRSAPPQLVEAQALTLKSVERALHCASPELDIEVRAVRFPDEPVDASWLTDMPILERSILDLGKFEIERRLPLLPDVLAGFGDSSEFDIAVLTNADIAVQPLFYDLIAEIADDGHDAFTITRRIVQPRFGENSLARFSVTGGTVHPGHDCFVMAPSLVDQLDPGDVSFGVRWVGRTLLWQLQLFAKRYRNFGELHATFHIGDDRVWVDPKLEAYERHNEVLTLALVERLVDRCGQDRVAQLVGTAPFLTAIKTGEPFKSQPPGYVPFPISARPLPGQSQDLIFSANPGRSGSGFLAKLLGSAPRTSAGHEREPTMTGPWLRRVAYEDPASSYADRMVKVDAIRSELGRMRARWAYVDTSHMFIKTFADVVFDEFQHELISVVVLRRDPIAVTKSFFELDYLGVRPRAWFDWVIPPTAPYAAFHLDPADVEDQFDLIMGYLVDCEVRTEALRELTPAVTWIDVTLDEITTTEGAAGLLRSLQLTPPANLTEIVAERVNQRESTKSELNQGVSIDYVRQRVGEFLQRHAGREEISVFSRNNGLEPVR